jgi:hypothetical protein
MNSIAGNLGDWEEHLRESPHSPFNWIKQLLGIAEPAKEGGGVLGGIIDVIPKTSIRESFGAMSYLGGAYPIEQTISKEPSISDKVQGFDSKSMAFVEVLKGKGFSASQEPTFSNIGMAADTTAVDFSGRNAIADVNLAEIGRFAPQANRVGLRQSQQIGVG